MAFRDDWLREFTRLCASLDHNTVKADPQRELEFMTFAAVADWLRRAVVIRGLAASRSGDSSTLAALLDTRAEVGTMVARGDNCEGRPVKEAARD